MSENERSATPLDQSEPVGERSAWLNGEMARAWEEDRFEEANGWIALGADPMSVSKPLLAISLANGQIDRALALAPHRWPEAREVAKREWAGSDGVRRSGMPNPLHVCIGLIATAPKAVEVLKILLERGVDPNLKESHWGRVMHAVERAVKESALDALEALIKAGANIHVDCGEGGGLLHLAIWGWDDAAAGILLKAGIDRNRKNDQGQRADDLISLIPSEKARDRARACFGEFDAERLARQLEEELAGGKKRGSAPRV